VSTGAKRLIAIAVAVALVVGALAIHGDLGGGGGGGGSDSGDGKQRLLCSTEVATACDELARETGIEVDVAPAGDTVAQLSTASDADVRALGYDGWLTLERDTAIVRDARARTQLEPVLESPSDPIARSPLVLAAWKERAAVLAPTCGGTLTWKCLGDVAGTRWVAHGGQPGWGDVKPGHADPQTTAEGLAIIGQAASQYFGRIDLSLDDYSDDGFLEWFTQLERAVPTGTTDQAPFERMLTAGPAAFDVVATTEAEAGPLLAAAARDRRDAVTLLYPAPVATADVVYAPIAGGDGDLGDTVTGDDGRAALAHAGFRVDGEDRAPGVPDRPALPKGSNLPSAGALEALLQTWREVTG
jgi:hypothetical protein